MNEHAAPLTSLESTVRQIAAALDEEGRKWAFVGALAISARAGLRASRDVEIAISVSDDQDARGLVFDLQAGGFQVAGAIAKDAAGRTAAVRLRSVGETHRKGIVVDLLFASSGVEDEIASAAERIPVLPGLVVPVALPAHLIALNVLSRGDVKHPREAEDLRSLLARASAGDLALARDLLRLVIRRGSDRGKDLERELDRAVTDFGP